MPPTTLRVVHTISSLQGGGMEHFVLRLAESQRRRGHDASVVAITGGPLLDIARHKGVPTTVLRGADRLVFAPPGADKAARVAHAAAHFALHRPRIVHCHNPTSLHYATIGKLAAGARLIFTDHAQTKGIVRVPSEVEWRLVDAYASVSAETARHAIDIGYRGTPDVVHNGIEIKPAQRPRAEVRAELGFGERLVAVNVASFFAVKAQDVLVRAAAHLRDRGVPFTAVCLGDGAERPAVEKLAKELELGPEYVRFLGFRNDVPDILAASDLFVLPSRAEGFPMSILEAMSYHLPVVCTPVGGNPELVTDGEHGYLVPVDDHRGLADAMEKLAKDPDLRRRQGESGYTRVRDEFSFERTTDKYEALYRRALSAPLWQTFTRLAGGAGGAGGA